MKIKEKPMDERPYEKFEKYGADALSDTELLAILLRSGTGGCNVTELAHNILSYKTTLKDGNALLSLYEVHYEELCQIKGVGKVKALQILAVLELSKRLAKARYRPTAQISSPSMVANYFMEILRHYKEEHFIVALLDAKCKLLAYENISKGSLTASIVHPREVYKIAIARSAYSIIVVHNHPSGDPTPSKEDIGITKRLKEAGEIIGIPLLDHIVIGDSTYKSFKEESYL